jgi:hypothetical protein
MSNARITSWVVVGGLSLGLVGAAHATVTALDYYRLGDADAGATIGSPSNATTADSAPAPFGGLDLTKSANNSPTYAAPIADAALHTGSTRAVNFGGNSFYRAGTFLTNATTNWGMETWVTVNPLAPGVTAIPDGDIVHNGVPGATGLGLIVNNFFGSPRYFAHVSGVATVGATSGASNLVVPGVPVHLAAVVTQDPAPATTSKTTLYINGVVNATFNGGVPAATSDFFIGGRPNNSNFVNGVIDETRIFTFNRGEFSVNDLLVNAPAVPEPTTALLVLPAAGLMALRRRRRV